MTTEVSAAPGSAAAPQRGGRGARILVGVSSVAIVLGSVGLFAGATLVRPFSFPSESMEPTIPKRSVLWATPATGDEVKQYDIIVHERPPDEVGGAAVPFLAKRVVAVGGDTIEYAGGHLLVNGQPTREDFLPPGDVTLPGPEELGRKGPATVPASTVYALGDNRQNSQDSRYHGPIAFEQIRFRHLATAPSGSTAFVRLSLIALVLLGAGGLVVGLLRLSRARRDAPTVAGWGQPPGPFRPSD